MQIEPAHPARRVIAEQGRSLTWVARQLGLSRSYLHRILLPDGSTDARRPPADFYERLSLLLSVPEDALRPDYRVAA